MTSTAPTTALLVPAGGSTLRSGVYVDAAASSEAGITSVKFVVTGDGLDHYVVATGYPTYFGYFGGFETTGLANGTYSLQSVATDANGASTTSAPITVTVDNLPLATTVLVPSAGASLHDGSVLDASAMGLSPVRAVHFELNGQSLTDKAVGTATLTAYGWIASLDTAEVSPGSYTLTSVATDATETARSPEIAVTVGTP